jgi:hypothetical protein
MNEPLLNPYAPPASELRVSDQIGGVFRSKKLVRLDRHGQLPERCVRCNAPGSGQRFNRKLLWSPLPWRMALLLSVAAFIGLASLLDSTVMAILFWPMIFLLVIVHVVIRKRVEVDLAVCELHRRIHYVFLIGSLLLLVATIALIFAMAGTRQANISMGIGILIPVMLLLELLRRAIGPLAVRIAKLNAQHVWLRGTGRRFRDSLPELD